MTWAGAFPVLTERDIRTEDEWYGYCFLAGILNLTFLDQRVRLHMVLEMNVQSIIPITEFWPAIIDPTFFIWVNLVFQRQSYAETGFL